MATRVNYLLTESPRIVQSNARVLSPNLPDTPRPSKFLGLRMAGVDNNVHISAFLHQPSNILESMHIVGLGEAGEETGDFCTHCTVRVSKTYGLNCAYIPV